MIEIVDRLLSERYTVIDIEPVVRSELGMKGKPEKPALIVVRIQLHETVGKNQERLVEARALFRDDPDLSGLIKPRTADPNRLGLPPARRDS